MNQQLQHNIPQHQTIDDWMKLKDFTEKHPQFEIQQLRWLLLRRKTNGLSEHVRKIGKSLYLSESGFLSWINEYQNR